MIMIYVKHQSNLFSKIYRNCHESLFKLNWESIKHLEHTYFMPYACVYFNVANVSFYTTRYDCKYCVKTKKTENV